MPVFPSRTISVLFLLLACAASVEAQGQGGPIVLTNRHIGLGNDATATSWDPSLLGINTSAVSAAVGAPYSIASDSLGKSPSFVNTPLYAFGRWGPVGLGISTKWANDSLGDALELVPTRYYLGLGFELPLFGGDMLWFGAGLRASNGGAFFGNAEYTASVTAQPTRQMLVSVVAEDFTQTGGPTRIGLYGAYQPFTWGTLLANLSHDGRDTAGGASSTRFAIGAGLGSADWPVNINANYEFSRKVFRLGLDLTLTSSDAAMGVGAYADLAPEAHTGGAIVLRYGSIEPSPLDPSPEYGSPVARRDARGWAPNRAYTPAGLSYRIQTDDATQSRDALVRPCEPTGKQFDTPSGLMDIVKRAGAPYPPLAQRLQEMSPNPEGLYKEIRREYYATNVRSRELMRGDSLQLISRQGYSIGVQSVDQSKYPQVSVIVQVTDAAGRNVRGLKKDDFSFRDAQTTIRSVRPLDSTFNVPVDIVILLDCSASMRDEIQAVRTNVQTFVSSMQARGADYRIGGVMYGAMIYDTLHPTSDIGTFNEFAAHADAIGNDEITTLAIKAATEMNFRPGAQRVFLLITDDWAVQDNARLNEPDLVDMLWNTGARLYTIGNPCSNNGAVMTRLSLGREYNITQPFNSILDDIGADVTTQYEIVYDSRLQMEAVTILRGRMRDDAGHPASVPIALRTGGGKPQIITPNRATGEFETEVTEGLRYEAEINGGRYLPLTESIDLTSARKGDTVLHDFTLRLPPSTLVGTVTDENGAGVPAEVRIEDAATGEPIKTVRTSNNGRYELELPEGRAYHLTAINRDYIPTPADLDARGIERGTKMRQDLKVMSIESAITRGTTFKINNIFFDVAKWDLKPESYLELNRVVALLSEYPTINVEIGAHTDAVGTDKDNQALSQNRARSVMEYLIGRGVDSARMRAKGYGETVPVASNDTEEGRALNRRVEFKLVR